MNHESATDVGVSKTNNWDFVECHDQLYVMDFIIFKCHTLNKTWKNHVEDLKLEYIYKAVVGLEVYELYLQYKFGCNNILCSGVSALRPSNVM